MKQTETNSKPLRELASLKNAVDDLPGYDVKQLFEADKRKTTGKFYLTDEKGVSITGAWNYTELNHFILGYKKALKRIS